MVKRMSSLRSSSGNSLRARYPHSYHQHRRDRVAGGDDYWIFGTHAALAALSNPDRECSEIRVTHGFAKANQNRRELEGALIVDSEQLDNLLPVGSVHQGIAMRTRPLLSISIKDFLNAISPTARVCVSILDQATDPRNIGAILRSAAAFGVKALIVQDRHTPRETGAMAKAASGALEQVPIIRVTNLARTMGFLKANDFWCVGLDGNANKTFSEVNFSQRTALIFGSEGEGMRRLTQKNCDLRVKISVTSRVESLNLANAVGISFYEWAR